MSTYRTKWTNECCHGTFPVRHRYRLCSLSGAASHYIVILRGGRVRPCIGRAGNRGAGVRVSGQVRPALDASSGNSPKSQESQGCQGFPPRRHHRPVRDRRQKTRDGVDTA